jgi:hypothetical protein
LPDFLQKGGPIPAYFPFPFPSLLHQLPVVKDFLFFPMSSVTGHFVRRGVDVAYANYQAQDPKKQPSGLQVFGLILTALVLGLAMFSVSTTVAITRSMVNLS